MWSILVQIIKIRKEVPVNVCLNMYCFPSICLQVSVVTCKTHNSIQMNDIAINFSMIVYRTKIVMMSQFKNYTIIRLKMTAKRNCL